MRSPEQVAHHAKEQGRASSSVWSTGHLVPDHRLEGVSRRLDRHTPRLEVEGKQLPLAASDVLESDVVDHEPNWGTVELGLLAEFGVAIARPDRTLRADRDPAIGDESRRSGRSGGVFRPRVGGLAG